MSLDAIRTAVAALEAAGTDVSIRTLQQALPDVGRSTLARHWATLRAERGHAQDPADPSTATAVLEPPDQGVQQAQAALEGARQHLAAVQRTPALGQRLSLVLAQRGGIITRSDPAWRDFDDATQQLARATEAVEQAEEDLKAADRRRLAQLRTEAEAAFSATTAGARLLAELAELQRLYNDAAKAELGSVASYSDALGRTRAHFNAGVSKVLASMQPAEPGAPSGPPSRLTPEMLHACYVNDGIGRVMPRGIERFEPEDYPALVAFREILLQEAMVVNRTYMDLQSDDELSHMAWHDPRALPLRQARQKTGVLHSAVQLLNQDILNVQRRARDTGHYL